jgi:cell division protease FtsH
VHKITIVPRTSGALGYTMQVDEEEKSLVSKNDAFRKLATYAGGRAAEALVFGDITTGAANDIQQMTRVARAMITQYGMSDDFGMMAIEEQTNPYLQGGTVTNASQETLKDVDDQVKALVQKAYDTAYGILAEHRPLLDRLAEYLLEKETITGKEFMDIIEPERSETENETI